MLDDDEEVRGTVTPDAFDTMMENDPQFGDKLVMSKYLSETKGLDSSLVYDSYEATAKANGFVGNPTVDRARALADMQISAQYEDVGFWKSEMGRLKSGGLRAGQFGDSVGLLLSNQKVEHIDESIANANKRLVEDKTLTHRQRDKVERRISWLDGQKVKWEAESREQVEDYTRKQIDILKQPLSARMRAFRQAEGVEGVKKLLNPLTLAEVLTEELIASTPGLATTVGGAVIGSAAGPGGTLAGGAAGAGLGEYAQGVSNNFFAYLQEQGVDTTSPEALEAALDNSELYSAAMDHAMIKSTPEAIAAAASLGVAKFGKPLVNALLVQPGLAGIGAASANLIVGEDIDLKDLATEMVAEMGGGGAIDVMTTRMLSPSKAFREKTVTATGVPMKSSDYAVAKGAVTDEQHTQGMTAEEAISVKKARDGDARAVKLNERIHQASEMAEGIGLKDAIDQKKVVGLTIAEANATREAIDLEPITKEGKQTFQSQIDAAKAAKMDEKALSIAAGVAKSPRALTTQEFYGMVLKETQLQNQMDDLDVQIIEAQEAGNTQLVQELRGQQSAIAKDIDTITAAGNKAGTESGRILNFRKIALNKEDFSLAKLTRKAEAAKGKKLTKNETDLFTALANEIRDLRARIKRQNRVIDGLSKDKVDQKLIDDLVILKVAEQKAKARAKKKLHDLDTARVWEEASFFGKTGITAIELATASRTLKTIGDISAFLRQGGFLVAGAPIKSTKAMVKSLKTMFNEDKFLATDMAIREHPNHVKREAAGLYLSPADRIDLALREEAFASNLVERLPGIRQVAFASERNMATFLNLVRVAKFDSFVAAHPDAGLETLTAVAEYINSASGRGSLPGMERSARALSVIFFAPRFATSRVQHAWRSAKLLKNKETRGTVLWDWTKFMGTGFGILSLGALAQGVDVGDDPLDSDFGKMVIGDTRVDIWGGFQQPFRLFATWIAKGAETAGAVELEKEVDVLDATMRFLMYKAAPTVTIPSEIVQGEDVVGNEKELWETLGGAFVPLYLQDTWEVFKGTQDPVATAAAMLGTGVGIGVTEQTPKKSKKKRQGI